MYKAARNLRRSMQSIAAILLLFAAPILHAAEVRTVTVVFFADHPMKDEQWSSLFTGIQSEMQIRSTERSNNARAFADSHLDFLRGDQIQPGIAVEDSISVYLHGDCSYIPAETPHFQPFSQHPQALGWVERSNNQITPFIHINCSLISHTLRTSALFLSEDRDNLTTLAITRVFLHEWLHIETQSSRHAHTGIAKSAFTADDLAGTSETARIPKKTQSESPALLSPLHGK